MVEKDYKEIGIMTPIKMFNRKLAEVVLKYNKLFRPFDEPCARISFSDKLEKLEKESERKVGFVEESLNITVEDLEEFANPNRFDLVEDQEAYKDKVIEGTRTQVIEGHTLSYKCKERGHGISVFMPMTEYRKMMSSTKAEVSTDKKSKKE